MSVKDVRVDQMYACQNRGVYERAKILKLINNDDEDKPKHVIVKFIDEGSITRVPVSNFFLFPFNLLYLFEKCKIASVNRCLI